MNLENNKFEQSLNNDEISIKDIIRKVKEWIIFFKTKTKIFIISILIGFLIGFIYQIVVPPRYTAELTFAMEDDKGGGGGLSGALGLASSFGIELGSTGGGAFAASNLTELMKSRLIVEKVLLSPIQIKNETKSIVEYYIQINNLRENWSKEKTLKNVNFSPNSSRKNFSLQQDSILKKIYLKLIEKNNLDILQKDKKVTILTIQVKSQDELFSKVFCESLAKETSDFYIETKSKKARINVDVLQKQVDSIKNELNSAITGVATEVDNIYNLNPAFNIKGTPSKRKQIDVQSNTAILTNLVVQLELAKIALRKETPLIQLIDRPILPLENNKTGKIYAVFIGGFLFLFISIISVIFIRLYNTIN